MLAELVLNSKLPELGYTPVAEIPAEQVGGVEADACTKTGVASEVLFAGEVTVMIPFVVEAWEIAAQNKERKNTQLRFMNRSLVSTRWI